MKKEIKQKKGGRIRVTTLDERWYGKMNPTKKGWDELDFYPSTTWIIDEGYPKGIGLQKWLAQHGWKKSREIMNEKANQGSKIHQATEKLDKVLEVTMEDKFTNQERNQELITVHEWETLMTYKDWFDKTQPKVLKLEFEMFSDEKCKKANKKKKKHFINEELGLKHAGTADRLYEIDGELWLVDIKTSKNLYPSHKIQVSDYKHLLFSNQKVQNSLSIETLKKLPDIKLGILQIGYHRNKRGYKFTEVEDQFPLFESAYRIWESKNSKKKPKQRDYPIKIKHESNKKKKSKK